MIILSKSKDYYDYLVGVYGVDTKKVLDRKKEIKAEDLFFHHGDNYHSRTRWMRERDNTYSVFIANRKYIVEQVAKGEWQFHVFHKVNTDHLGKPRHMLMSEVPDPEKLTEDWDMFIDSDYNRDKGRVLSIQCTYGHYARLGGVSPILQGFGFPSILTPELVYSEIDMMVGWHIDNPCKVGQLDDKSKILANGFDDKISFRHR